MAPSKPIATNIRKGSFQLMYTVYIRSKRVAREKVAPLKDKGENLYVELEDVGEILNEYFALVVTKEKNMVDGEYRERCVDTPGHVDGKKEVVLGVLKNIKADRSQDLMESIPEYRGRDFSNAFDKVSHGKLLQKVKSHGICSEL
eukprot:g38766.t1